MALEDFTTYTEVDENADITVVANTITVDTIRRDATSYVKYAYPASTFGNFVHKLDFNWTGATSDTGVCAIWQVSNSSNTVQNGLDNNEGLAAFFSFNTPNLYRLNLYNYANDATAFYNWSSLPGIRYLTIQRIGTALTCAIYTDAGRTTLEAVVSITCASTAYANIYGLSSRDAAPTSAPDLTFTVSNLDLQFVSAGGGTVATSGGGSFSQRRSSISVAPQPARKPYLSLKESMKEFFGEYVRYLKNQNRKESAFEKPYLGEDYQQMHLDIPDPDWPTWTPFHWTPGDWQPGGDPGGGGHPVGACPGCALYADPPLDCNSPVEIHAGIWCTNTPGAQTKATIKMPVHGYTGNTIQDAQSEREVSQRVDGVSAGDTQLLITAPVGVIKEIQIGAWASIGPSAAVYVDSTVAQHTICGKLIDGAGNVCEACIDVSCGCVCPGTPSMIIDSANTDTTIAPGGTATITILGGCPPFAWSVTGQGYVLDALNTDGRSNRITSATGTCGTNWKAYAIVSVTDNCSIVATQEIMNTSGTWKQIGASGGGICTSGFCGPSVTCDEVVQTIYHGVLKQWNVTGAIEVFAQPSCYGGTNIAFPITLPPASSCDGDTLQRSETNCDSTCCFCASQYNHWACATGCI